MGYAAWMTVATRLDPLPDLPHAASRQFGLDLLRAIAILLVMVSHYANNVSAWFHLSPPPRLFFAGDLGVELFFALSGFLIGRILLQIADRGPTPRDLGIFLVRRWMRTLPLYFLWLGVLFACFPPATQVAAHAWRFATLTQNLLQPMPPDYFFAVSWSLAVEEWFYLLFATAFLGATWALRRPAPALWLCLAVFMLGPLALRMALLGFDPVSLDRGKEVFFRIDEIAYGVAAAWLFARRSVVFRHPWPPLLAGLALVGSVWAGHPPLPGWLWPSLSYNLTVIGCALCLPAALRLRGAAEWFAAPVRRLSAQSYALYLMHVTVMFDLVQNQLWGPGRLAPLPSAAIAVVGPFLLSAASFRWFEAPILRRRPSERRQAVSHASGEPPAAALLERQGSL